MLSEEENRLTLGEFIERDSTESQIGNSCPFL